MIASVLPPYVHNILSHIPWGHWVIICAAAVVTGVLFGIRKRGTVYGAIALGLTVFMVLFLLDTAVGIRYLGIMRHTSGHNLTLDFSRIFQKSGQGPVETLSNIAVFVPFGLFFAECLAETMRFSVWRRIGITTLAGFVLSLCIECLQMVLKVGFFELTDLFLNTVGGFLGAFLSVVGRVFWNRAKGV